MSLKLRIREELRAKIEKAARKSGISLNSEMERRLEATFDQRADPLLVKLVEQVKILQDRLEKVEARK